MSDPQTLMGQLLRNSTGDVPAELQSRAASALVRSRWARTSRAERQASTAPAFEGRMRRYRAAVDPDGILPEDERERLARDLMSADMAALAARKTLKRHGGDRRVFTDRPSEGAAAAHG